MFDYPPFRRASFAIYRLPLFACSFSLPLSLSRLFSIYIRGFRCFDSCYFDCFVQLLIVRQTLGKTCAYRESFVGQSHTRIAVPLSHVPKTERLLEKCHKQFAEFGNCQVFCAIIEIMLHGNVSTKHWNINSFVYSYIIYCEIFVIV